MKVLALEPYYGGSHRAFLDGWISRGRHQWTILTLPATKWKWRMRQAAITFAEDINHRVTNGESWDILFCSDMLNLAEFKGLVTTSVAGLPSVAYFHENQLTYPVREPNERDYHFGFSNFTTCLAATEIWFNSGFHQESFLQALRTFLKRLPDNQPMASLTSLPSKSRVVYPGLDTITCDSALRQPGPLRILWVARWEHDKNPDLFFAALYDLKQRGVRFQLSVIGEQFDDSPNIFHQAKSDFADLITDWGFRALRQDYLAVLRKADVVVSTADHEFFGIAILEAIASGTCPVLPDRLSYPELLQAETDTRMERFFYDGNVGSLLDRLTELSKLVTQPDWGEHRTMLRQTVERFFWSNVIDQIDDRLSEIAS